LLCGAWLPGTILIGIFQFHGIANLLIGSSVGAAVFLVGAALLAIPSKQIA